MSVEGLWWFQTTSVQKPDTFEDGGVVVLETGRVLGGDSIYAYIGDFEVHQRDLRARVRVRQWNPSLVAENVFGMVGPVDFEAEIAGTVDGEEITGTLRPAAAPELQLPIRMRLMERLL